MTRSWNTDPRLNFADDTVARLAAILESADVAIYCEDLTGTITLWNPAAERLYGYPAAEMVGHPMTPLIPPDRAAEEQDIRRRVEAGEQIDRYETVRRRKDGVRVAVSLSVSPLRSQSGEIVGASKFAHDVTERKRLDAQLWQTSRLVDLAWDAILAWDFDGGVTVWNSGCERLYGYPASEALGQVSHELLRTVHPEGRREFLEKLRETRQWFGDLRQQTRDGRTVLVESRQQVLENDGRLLVLETNRDLTERRRIDEATTRLAAIVESSEDAIIGKDLDGIVTSWNRGAERIFGYAADEISGRSIRLTVPEDRQSDEDEVLLRVREGRSVDHFETVRRRKDGTLFPIALTVSPVYGSAGTITGASSIARDITENKRAEQRAVFLAEAGAVLAGSLEYKSTLRSVAHLAVKSICDWCAVDILNEDGTLEHLAVAHVNAATIPVWNTVRDRYEDPSSPHSAAQVIRTGIPMTVPLITDAMVVAAGKGDEERVKLVRQLGLVSYICAPLAARGRTFGALTLATSESGRRYTDDDFRFAQDLARRAGLAVDNALAYRAAQAASRLKDEFLATLSHELRTPLNAILGYSRLLRSGFTAPERRARALEILERNATALTQIVEDVLDVSRIISGKIRLNVQPVDLSGVVQAAVDTIAPAAEAKGVRLLTILDPDAGMVSGDPDRLQQIVWNLASNAVKFTAKSGIVQIRLSRVHSHVEIDVSDTGIGIAPEFLPHMFERFRQADSSATRKHGGLGLGLAISRHLAELHGGTIEASSEGEGLGATFRVKLPVMIVHRERAPEARVLARADLTSDPFEQPDLTGVHVVAVDDDGDALTMVREILEAPGARVTTVESTARALEVVAQEPTDVILADIGMPGEDGFDLIAQLRRSADVRVRATPAAALTAYARSEDRVKALRSGFQMHLAKPVDPRELVSAVAALARIVKL